MTGTPTNPGASSPLANERPPQALPESHRSLLEQPALGYLATLMPNGTPQVTPVWVQLDEAGYIVFHSARGEQKDRNIRGRRRIALCVSDPNDPYRYVAIRGPVVQIVEHAAGDAADAPGPLASKYTAEATVQDRRPRAARVTYCLRPDHIAARG